LSSDGGLLLLRQVDGHLGPSRAAAAVIPDPRDPERIRHGLRDLLAQRLYGLCGGYEELNDHKTLRDDVLMQTVLGRDEALASAPTFSRLENRATRAQAWALHGVLIDQFIASHKTAPEELVLDIDASDVPLHGPQELSQFHGLRLEQGDDFTAIAPAARRSRARVEEHCIGVEGEQSEHTPFTDKPFGRLEECRHVGALLSVRQRPVFAMVTVSNGSIPQVRAEWKQSPARCSEPRARPTAAVPLAADLHAACGLQAQ
jgi:hypothetical protein